MKNVMMVFLSLFSAYALAQKPAVVTSKEAGWHKVGQTTANFKSESESIMVLGADEFKSLKLKVNDAALSIERLQVFYESGEMEEIDVRNQIQPGSETRVFNLKHAGKDISKVAFTYKTMANQQGEKAQVELYGLKGESKDSSPSYREDAERKADTTRHDMKKAAKDIKRKTEAEAGETKTLGEKTQDEISEMAAKGTATVTDQKHKSKVGPEGQTIYIDESNKYYYIEEDGQKVYVKASQLKDKDE